MAYKFNPFTGTLDYYEEASGFAPDNASYVVLGLNSSLTSERVLTGTANQITVTDNGAGSTVVLSLPQDIATASSPTFVGLTLSGLTASELLATGASKELVSLAVATYPSLTEISYVKGVTSAIQTQLNNARIQALGGVGFGFTSSVAVGDGCLYIPVPAKCNGMNLIRAQAFVITAGTTNATTVMVHNLTLGVNMLSGAISIASGATKGTVGTIDVNNDHVATDDIIRIDVDSVSTTAPLGLLIMLEFSAP